MDHWILQALALLVTAPWWLALTRHVVRSIREVSSPANAPGHPGRSEPNALAFERARQAWGTQAGVRDQAPRRLRNVAWETGRRARNPRLGVASLPDRSAGNRARNGYGR